MPRDHSVWLDKNPVENRGSVKAMTVNGGALNLLVRVYVFAIRFVSLVVLARLLEVDDFGLFATAFAILATATIFQDLGLTNAVLYAERLEQNQVSTAFYISLVLASAFTGVSVLLAPLMAVFFGREELADITAALSLIFVFTAIGAMQASLLKRQLRFKAMAVQTLVSVTVGIAAGLLLAYLGAGYWALVATAVLTPAVASAVAWLACGWRPSAVWRPSELGGLLGFGRQIMYVFTLGHVREQMSVLILGKTAGFEVVGLYNRAQTLFKLMVEFLAAPVNMSALLVLNKLRGKDQEYANYFYLITKIVGFVSFPAAFFVALMAPELVTIVLGDKWLEATKALQLLALSAPFYVFGSTFIWVAMSLEKTHRATIWGLLHVVILGIAVATLADNAEQAAGLYLAVTVLLFVPSAWAHMFSTPIRVPRVLWVACKPALSALVAVAACMMLDPSMGPALRLVLGALVFLLTYILVFALMFREKAWLLYGWNTVLQKFQQKLQLIRNEQ